MKKELTRYNLIDPSDIENLFLKFLRTVLSVEFLPGKIWSDDPETRTLDVNVSGNLANKKENACPAVYLELGDTVYAEMCIDHSSQYTDPELTAHTRNADGKIDPEYVGGGKRTLLQGDTPVSIEVRAYGRIPCMKLSNRLTKVFFAFASSLHDKTNSRISANIRNSKPALMKSLGQTVYRSYISFNVEHVSVEMIPETKDILMQFFQTVTTIGGTEPIEMHEVIKN